MNKTKICSKCKRSLPISEFSKDNTTKDLLQSICKECGKTYERNPSYRFRRWALNTIKTHKKYYKIEFSLEFLIEMAEKTTHCPICGRELNWLRGHKGRRPRFSNPSLDRINNEDVMTESNIEIVCHRCNTVKSDGSYEEMINYCKAIIERYNHDKSLV